MLYLLLVYMVLASPFSDLLDWFNIFSAPAEDRYHESINHPEYPLDDSDVVLEVFFPISGTHHFRNITSFLILFAPHLDAAKNTMLWHHECRDRQRIHGLDTCAAFVTDLYALNIRPATFLQDTVCVASILLSFIAFAIRGLILCRDVYLFTMICWVMHAIYTITCYLSRFVINIWLKWQDFFSWQDFIQLMRNLSSHILTCRYFKIFYSFSQLDIIITFLRILTMTICLSHIQRTASWRTF